MHCHPLRKWDANLPHSISPQTASSHGHNLSLKPFSIEKEGKTGAQHPSSQQWFCTCSCLSMLAFSSMQAFSHTNPAVRLAVRHSPAMLETLSLSLSHPDTLIPLVWGNHCPDGAAFAREKGSAWGSSATESGSWQSQRQALLIPEQSH